MVVVNVHRPAMSVMMARLVLVRISMEVPIILLYIDNNSLSVDYNLDAM